MDKEKACCHITPEVILISWLDSSTNLEKRLKIRCEYSKINW